MESLTRWFDAFRRRGSRRPPGDGLGLFCQPVKRWITFAIWRV